MSEQTPPAPLNERLHALAVEGSSLSAHVRLRAALRSVEGRKLSRATVDELRRLSGTFASLSMALDELTAADREDRPVSGWRMTNHGL